MEWFFEQYQYTFQALTALGTLSAVVISLWLARRRYPKLKCILSVRHRMEDDHTTDTAIFITIINKGDRVVYIPECFLSYCVPFCKTHFAVNTSTWSPIPIELHPGKAQFIKVQNMDDFQKHLPSTLSNLNLTWFKQTRLNKLKAYIVTEDGYIFYVKMHEDLKKKIKQLLE